MEAKLIMFKNDGQRKDFPVTGPTVSLGRGEDCDLRVPLLSVSRRHCELTVTDEGINVRDLGSSNGTYLNNNRISEEVVLKAGDRLAVGPVVFTVQIDGKPEEIQPVKSKDPKAAEEEHGEGKVTIANVGVTAAASAESGEDVVAAPPESEQVQEKAEVKEEEKAEVKAEEKAEVKVEEKAEVKVEEKTEVKVEEKTEVKAEVKVVEVVEQEAEEEEEEEESALETIADASEEEEIDPISALEALANKRAKKKRDKPPSG